VSISAPGAGQTVSGTVILSAGASDNVAVAGVQFLIDGGAYGAEDTSAPYSTSINTTALTNGSHTIAATARDTSGNRRTSTVVTFNVSNAIPPPPTTFTPIRVNVGGGAYMDPEGLAWTADYGFNGGSVLKVTAPIANTTANPMYQDQRHSPAALTYEFAVPNGNYDIYLKFAELSTQTTGQRLFHVDVNGTRVFANFDVYANGGRNTAVKRTVPVSVSSGRIRITFTPTRSSAIINAIEIGKR
jgi:hypothetical protein